MDWILHAVFSYNVTVAEPTEAAIVYAWEIKLYSEFIWQ